MFAGCIKRGPVEAGLEVPDGNNSNKKIRFFLVIFPHNLAASNGIILI